MANVLVEVEDCGFDVLRIPAPIRAWCVGPRKTEGMVVVILELTWDIDPNLEAVDGEVITDSPTLSRGQGKAVDMVAEGGGVSIPTAQAIGSEESLLIPPAYPGNEHVDHHVEVMGTCRDGDGAVVGRLDNDEAHTELDNGQVVQAIDVSDVPK